METERAEPTTHYVVTNNVAHWLARSLQGRLFETYVWTENMREAHLFDNIWTARLAAFQYGGYVVELTSR